MLDSDRVAILDDGIGFRLVPWWPTIDKRLGQTVSAIVRGESAHSGGTKSR
jgi:uncharacterized protein DUF3363